VFSTPLKAVARPDDCRSAVATGWRIVGHTRRGPHRRRRTQYEFLTTGSPLSEGGLDSGPPTVRTKMPRAMNGRLAAMHDCRVLWAASDGPLSYPIALDR
jgi:hypothetical protein